MAFHHYNIGQERSVSPTGNNLITDLLKHARNIAVVGLSSSPLRPSHGVAAYMQTQGYRIIPVNPTIEEALGEKSYPSLLDVPEKIDIVNVFRRPEYLPELAEQAVRKGARVLWGQLGVVNLQAAERARAGTAAGVGRGR